MSSLYSVYLTRSLVSESALIAAKYTEESVDEMMKPDADTDAYKERMVELRKKVKRDIYAWTKSFVNEAQRQPSKQERKDLASAMFRAYTGVRA
jgi:trehalose-6-phosphate synthase